MKQVKKIFLVLALLASAFATNAQTKEETIAWLQPKLLEYSSFNTFIIKDFKIEISECQIVLSGNDEDEKLCKSIFPTNFTEMAHSEDGSDFFKGKYYLKYSYEAYQTIFDGKMQPYANEWHFLKNDTPPEMAARIEKALRHLVTFCSKYQKSEDEPF